MIDLADGEVVSGPGVDVQLRRHPGPLQGQVEEDAVFRRTDDIRASVYQEDRRRTGWDAQAGCEFVPVLDLEISGIGGDGEIGPAADLVDVVDGVIGSFLEAGGGG